MNAAPLKIISIVCPLYSGSTLLTLLLATHPDIGTLGEGQKFHSRVIRPASTLPETARTCSCGQLFTACDVWQTIQARARPRIPTRIWALNFTGYHFYARWSLNKLARRMAYVMAQRGWPLPPLLRGRYAQVCRANEVFVQTVLEVLGAQVYLDATKNLVNTVLMAAWPGFDVHIIHLSRDARAQIASALKYQPQWSVETAAHKWVAEVSEARRELQPRRLLSRPRYKVVTVRYEELCERPAEIMAQIYQFCGLDPAQGSLEFRRFDQHVMGNFGTRTSHDSTIADRQEWRTRLTPEQLATIERLAGPLNHTLGYAPASDLT